MYRVVPTLPGFHICMKVKHLGIITEACNLTFLHRVKHKVFLVWFQCMLNLSGMVLLCEWRKCCILFNFFFNLPGVVHYFEKQHHKAFEFPIRSPISVRLCSCHIHYESPVSLSLDRCRCLITSLCHLCSCTPGHLCIFPLYYRQSIIFVSLNSLCRQFILEFL